MRLLVVYCEVPLGLGRCEAQTTGGCTHYLVRTGGGRLRSGGCGCCVGAVWMVVVVVAEVIAGAGVRVLSVVRRPVFLLVHVTTGK